PTTAAPPETAPPETAPGSTTAPPPPNTAACPLVVDDPAPPLHVRAEPSSRAPVVGDAPNGTRITVLERRGRWARIDAPAVGWIWTESVRPRCE
ncbi:MAG: SH3 domain-containing protein, partial [Myxococcota bacterium]|nr:SH3 domain-containing protein [Myxococcota bacterium]